MLLHFLNFVLPFSQELIDMNSNEKVKQFIELLQDHEVQAFLKLFNDNCIATSELKILKRLSTIESMLGLNDTEDLEDMEEKENHPSLSDRIETLEVKIDNISTSRESILEKPKSTLEQKACELVDYLRYDVKERVGGFYMTAREVIHFLKNEVTDHLRLGDVRNPRQAKKDVIEKAAKLFPQFISLDKSKHRNREVRIVFRPPSVSTQSIHTYTGQVSSCYS
jgi:hypothetical protein